MSCFIWQGFSNDYEVLQADWSRASNFDYDFDGEHQQMFLENAQSLASFIPGMISEENVLNAIHQHLTSAWNAKRE